MSLARAIQHRKERRRPYRDSRRFDPACRNHGSCSWCRNRRTYQARKTELAAHQAQKEN